MTVDNRLRLLYHYTSLANAESIFASMQLRTSRVPRSRLAFDSAVEVVWLTDAAEPGRGADHGLGPAVPAQDLLDRRAVRFTVSVNDAQHWPRWAPRRRISRRTQRALDEAGGGLSGLWWVVPRPIPATEWVCVDNLRTGQRIWPFVAADRRPG